MLGGLGTKDTATGGPFIGSFMSAGGGPLDGGGFGAGMGIMGVAEIDGAPPTAPGAIMEVVAPGDRVSAMPSAGVDGVSSPHATRCVQSNSRPNLMHSDANGMRRLCCLIMQTPFMIESH